MSEFQAIDTMNRPQYARPEMSKKKFEVYEYQVMSETTFGGLKDRLDIDDGEEWKILAHLGNESIEETLEEMDENDVEYTFMDQVMMWSRRESKLLQTATVEELAGMSDEADGRIVPGVGYNPHRIRESLDRIERAVEDQGFKYIWFHPSTFGIEPTNEKCYPLYSKAVELDIPVCFQTGHSAEPLPSSPGRPMSAENVAMDFPDLTLVLTHAGWPWYLEWVSMLWRFPNVYGNFGAYYPSFFPDELIEFIDSGRIRDKVLWATNGLGIDRCLEEVHELELRDKTKRRVLRENALDIFDL